MSKYLRYKPVRYQSIKGKPLKNTYLPNYVFSHVDDVLRVQCLSIFRVILEFPFIKVHNILDNPEKTNFLNPAFCSKRKIYKKW